MAVQSLLNVAEQLLLLAVVKANNIQASDAGNIISQSGTTITLGASGDTINLASVVHTQSGFGRTGTVDWDTTPKTATFSVQYQWRWIFL